MHWLFDIVAGVALALLLYALVRVRMRMAPRMRDRFGDYARWAIWVVTIGLMVVLANLGLVLLRQLLHSRFGIDVPFPDEMVFAVVAFGVGFFLVFRHVTRNHDS
jgi:uncharacterized membrane protein